LSGSKRERALRGDPRRDQADQEQHPDDPGEDDGIARRGLVHDRSEYPRREYAQGDARDGPEGQQRERAAEGPA
jgi:hypothetical protein